MIGRREQTELLPPSQYTRERDADKDARQKVLDEQNKAHRDQVRQLAEASFKLRELDVKMEVEELKSKVRQATIAREQALKLMNELGRLDITKPESYAKRLEIQQKYPAAVLDKNGADFLKGWVDNFDTAQKSANDIKAKREEYENELRMKREEHFTTLNDANILAKGEDLAGNKTTTISTGHTVKPMNLTTTPSATVTAGGLHPRYEALDPEKARSKAEADALKAKDAASKVLPDIDKRMQAEFGVGLSQVQDPAARMRRVNPAKNQSDPTNKDKDYSGSNDLRSDPNGSHYAFDVLMKNGKARTVTIPMDRFKSYADEYQQAIAKPAPPSAPSQPDSSVVAAPVKAPAITSTVAPMTSASTIPQKPVASASTSATPSVSAPAQLPKPPIYTSNPGALRIEDVPDAPEVKSRAEFEAMPEGAAVRYGSKIIWKPVKQPAAVPAVASAADEY